MRRALLLVLALLAGCTQAPTVDHSLLVSCPESFMPAMKALAEGYSKVRPQCKVLGNGGGSTAAILAVRRGAVDIAVCARDLTLQEDDNETHAHLLARVGLAVIVNSANPVDDISLARLQQLAQGRLADWKDLGGPPGPVTVVLDPVWNRLGLPETVGVERVHPYKSVDCHDPAEVNRVVAATPGALGFLPWEIDPKPNKVLKVGGVPLTPLTMTSGRYPLSRSLFLVRHGDSAFEEQGFSDFCLSPEGQQILTKNGYRSRR